MRIGIIICYFGRLPWYFDYFLHSCSFNPTVDFYVITDDQTYDQHHPCNVHFIYQTLSEVNKRAASSLGFPVKIENGYKMCDFKPAFGFLFAEIIEGYDFWGHGDIDVIYGDIRNFITDEVMQNYDLISVRPDWLSGCFLLFKNCDRLNKLFMLSRDYRKVFSDSRHYCFDETNFQHHDFTNGKRYVEIPSEIESMMHLIQKMEDEGYIKPYFDLHIIEGRPGRLKWEKGKLTYKNEYEALLYHLIKLKMVYRPEKKPNSISETFFISPTRIYS